MAARYNDCCDSIKVMAMVAVDITVQRMRWRGSAIEKGYWMVGSCREDG
jgi:hypothetical protein